MCNPALIVMGAQAGIQLVGQMNAANQGADALSRNIKLADMKIDDTTKRGALAEGQKREESRQLMGAQKASMGASGLDSSSASFRDITANTAAETEQDALTIRSNAAREAWGYQVERDQLKEQKDALERQSDMYKTILTGGLSSKKFRKFNSVSLGTPLSGAALSGARW